MGILICFIIAFLIETNCSFAQELPMYSQYLLNPFLANPAVAGSEKGVIVTLTDRHQWFGITGAPQTQTLGFTTRLGNSNGIGATVFSDRVGAISKIGLNAAYAHLVVLNRDAKVRLSFGGAFSIIQYNMDNSGFGDLEMNDPAIRGVGQSLFIPNASAGVYLFSPKFNVGISVANLIQPSIRYQESIYQDNKQVRNYFANAGYIISINREIKTEPSVMFKTNEAMEYQIDGNLKVLYLDKYWFGISYRTSKTIMALFGFKFKNLQIAYAFDFTQNEIYAASFYNHEVMLSYKLKEKEGAVKCPAFK
jgi:type IX secretion system PorP/SprF family membrane protein